MDISSVIDMNREITIRHIGPIEDISLKLNTINVFMGPQSSGKSTIAKLLSFCMWLDKEVTLHQDIGFLDKAFVEKELFSFHKVGAYFDSESFFKYESEILSIEYENNGLKAIIKPGIQKAKVGKVAYIPAERIIVSMDEIRQFDLQDHNVRAFVFDWLKMRTKYNSSNRAVLEYLSQTYYFDEASGRDIMVLEDGKEIPFAESSSGIQSLVPLFISLKYLTDWIYHNKEDLSYEKKELIENVVAREFLNASSHQNDKLSESGFAALQSDPRIKTIKESLSKLTNSSYTIDEPKDDFETALSMAVELTNRLNAVHFSDIVIEEPELNLFPETQAGVVRQILKDAKNGRDSYVITTHSPYILFAINNCMMGGLVSDKITEEERNGFPYRDSWISPKKVSVFEIHDGRITSPQDEDGILENNYLNQAYQKSSKEYLALLGYYDSDSSE